MKTINSTTSAHAAVIFAVTGGKFRLRLIGNDKPGRRYAQVLDDDNNVIGGAMDFIYGGSGFAVHTGPYAGHVSVDQIEFV